MKLIIQLTFALGLVMTSSTPQTIQESRQMAIPAVTALTMDRRRPQLAADLCRNISDFSRDLSYDEISLEEILAQTVNVQLKLANDVYTIDLIDTNGTVMRTLHLASYGLDGLYINIAIFGELISNQRMSLSEYFTDFTQSPVVPYRYITEGYGGSFAEKILGTYVERPSNPGYVQRLSFGLDQ